jgi:hypothetical protein
VNPFPTRPEAASIPRPGGAPASSQRAGRLSRGPRVAVTGLLVAALALLVACDGGPEGGEREWAPTEHVELSASSAVASPELVDGWVAFLEGLDEARRGLEDPSLFPPEPTDRNLAEGYRYLLGHLVRIIEAQTQRHPDFPAFQRSVRMLSKWTIDNPDTMYLSATIDADGVYRIRGRALDTGEWRTSERGRRGPRAPRVVIFQTTTAVIGDTGRLTEFVTCRNQTLEAIDQFALELDDEGRFEILIAAERPPDHAGHFLTTRRELPCATPVGLEIDREREATQLNVREIFSDWREEVPLELEIVRLDKRGAPRPPRTSAEMGEHLAEIGRKLPNQIAFWNALHERGLEVNDDENGDGRRAMPMNGLNPASPPFIAGGTAGAGQLYSGGLFELTQDEALVVRVEAPLEPHYLGFQLANLWGESLDQANYVSSQTGAQNPPASDGARYYVVAARDPGTPGWLDTSGLPKGTMSMRFIYRDAPSSEESPQIESFVTKLARVRDQLPADTPMITPEARRLEVDERQRHIQMRWRQY